MYISSVQVLATAPLSLSAAVPVIDGYQLKPWESVLLNGQANTRENGVYWVLPDMTLKRSEDFTILGSQFEDFRIWVLRGDTWADTRWTLHVPLGSDFGDLAQVYVQNFDPDPQPEEPPADPQLQ